MAAMDKMREEKAKEEQPTAPAESGFATAVDFKDRFKTSVYTLQDGLPIKYRAALADRSSNVQWECNSEAYDRSRFELQ